MKKGLLLLPLSALLLTGCKINLFGKTFYLFEKNPGTGEYGEEGPEGSQTKFKGLTITPDSLMAELGETEGKGYAAYSGISLLDGITASLDGVMANILNEESFPKWSTPNNEGAPVIQFRKDDTKNDASKTPGKLMVKGMIKKLTVKLYNSGQFSATSIPTVTFNGKNVAKPTSATKTEATEYAKIGDEKNYDIKLYTCVYNVNADAVHSLVIANTFTYALYFHSFILE